MEEPAIKNKFEKYMPSTKFPEVKGNALQIGAALKKNKDICVIVEMAKQNKAQEARGANCFDWKSKIIMSLGVADIATILGYIVGRSKECKLIHKYPVDGPAEQQKTTVLEFKYSDKSDLGVKLSQRKAGEHEFAMMQVYLTPGEIEVLDVLLRHVLVKMYDSFDL